MVTLRLATTDRRKSSDGNWTDHTEWHSVVVFGRQAENVGRFCRKGKQLFVEGRIQTRKWQDRDGRDRYNTEIVADNIRFLGGRGESAEAGGYGNSNYGGNAGGGNAGGGYAGGANGGNAGGANGSNAGGANNGGDMSGGNPGGGNDAGGGEMPYRDDDIPF